MRIWRKYILWRVLGLVLVAVPIIVAACTIELKQINDPLIAGIKDKAVSWITGKLTVMTVTIAAIIALSFIKRINNTAAGLGIAVALVYGLGELSKVPSDVLLLTVAIAYILKDYVFEFLYKRGYEKFTREAQTDHILKALKEDK